MLSLPQIQRHLLDRDYDQLLIDLVRNGTLLPMPLRLRLSQSPGGCLGLALRRVVELTHGPTHLGNTIFDGLLAECVTDHDPIVLAACLSGIERARALGAVGPDQADALEQCANRLWFALAQRQQHTGLLGAEPDRTETDLALTSAFVVYLLAPVSSRAHHLDLSGLLTALEDRRPLDDRAAEELVQVALASWPRATPVARPLIQAA
ncbi:hypothetical protein [Mucisphaera calidilacus]|uniref:Uncharacterized protein n=1 Tax=Mucisphaera calidilacus TaxID=2527982 RepID=A0A518BWH0_9BACT|nr:hypothetical protein [Mucisphaera calidilacus]QDU71320.1 hypothetical protein Pan265_11690 [Mucisphaera calidilacus]